MTNDGGGGIVTKGSNTYKEIEISGRFVVLDSLRGDSMFVSLVITGMVKRLLFT